MAQRVSERLRQRSKLGKNEPDFLRDLRWWKKEDPHQDVWDNFKRIGRRTQSWIARDRYYACLYDDEALATAIGAVGEFTPQTMATNIIRRQVDTFVAKIAKNRPVPMGLTTAGNYSQQRRAKGISTFFAGILDEVKFWPTRTLRLRDAGVLGSGVALNFRRGRKLFHERLFKTEVRVCPIDAEKGNPRTIYIGRRVDKLILAEQFPEFAKEIFEAESDDGEGSYALNWEEDTRHLALVIMAWHLPSSEDADDGACAITISNATLACGEYKADTFPLSKYDFQLPMSGYWGTGIASMLEGVQYEVNAMGLKLQEREYLMGGYWMRRADDEMSFETLDNGSGTEVVYQTSPPTYVAPAAAHPQTFEWWRELRTKLPGEITGISGLSSRAEKPAGLDSGKAIRTFHDIDSENLTPQGRADEEDVVETCWRMFDLAEEIYAETGKERELPKGKRDEKRAAPYTVRTESRKYGRSVLEEIDYGKVRLDRKAFKLRTFPTNFLRGTPEEQMQSVNEMIEAGFLSQDEATMLLDFPDLQRVLNLKNAARKVVEKILGKICEAETAEQAEAAYQYPEPAMNLELCKALGLMTYLDEKCEGADEFILKKLMQFSLDAAAEIEKASQPAPGVNGPEDAPPPGTTPEEAAMAAGGPLPPVDPAMAPELYAPPEAPLLPEGAVAPEAIPTMPGAPA